MLSMETIWNGILGFPAFGKILTFSYFFVFSLQRFVYELLCVLFWKIFENKIFWLWFLWDTTTFWCGCMRESVNVCVYYKRNCNSNNPFILWIRLTNSVLLWLCLTALFLSLWQQKLHNGEMNWNLWVIKWSWGPR